ncbi:MAG: methionyl-tRNA formyltransferase [Ruminococcaceae bacterium]|nr:methionyl-tRNA formyltransferase [Oscillospiraceae bacterium]
MRILFMGTPDYAVFSLKALCEAGENVVGAVTQPDKPKGRGYELQPPPVKVYANEQGIPVYQPERLRNGEFDDTLREIDPDVICVVAYGKILPPSILDYPRYGCINVHGSLLPRYRGAAPMQRAIMDGLSETGVTTMRMDVGLDTGDMLLECRVPIGENDNFEVMHDRLGEAGASLLLKTLGALERGDLVPRPQDGALATYAAKIEKVDCRIDFSASADQVHNRIRGLSPIPLAFTRTPDQRLLKVLESRVGRKSGVHGAPGTVLSLGESVEVACGEGTVLLLRLLPEGKGRMSAADYVRGRRLSVGDILGKEL